MEAHTCHSEDRLEGLAQARTQVAVALAEIVSEAWKEHELGPCCNRAIVGHLPPSGLTTAIPAFVEFVAKVLTSTGGLGVEAVLALDVDLCPEKELEWKMFKCRAPACHLLLNRRTWFLSCLGTLVLHVWSQA